MDDKKQIEIRGHLIDANARVVKKRLKFNGMGSCTICGGINGVTGYTVYPQKLLSDTTDWAAGQRKAVWQMLSPVSMPLCDDCIREHSRYKIKKSLLQIPFCALLTAGCAFLINIIPIASIQGCIKFVGVISALGILTGIIDILCTVSGAKKKKKPTQSDGQVCVRDLIESQYEGCKINF